jgi:circadian clock protein KaiB
VAAKRTKSIRPKAATKKPVATEPFEKAGSRLGKGISVLRLYVAGMGPRSVRAIANLKSVCEEYLPGRYDLEVIDIYQQKSLGMGEQIIAAPTLIKKLPLPVRKLIGDMSNKEKVLIGLGVRKDKT